MKIQNNWQGDVKLSKAIDEHPKQVGYAFRNAVNETVYEVQQAAQDIFSRHFTERNKFTKRGIQYDRSKKPTIEDTEAVVGGKLNRPWLRDQNEGFKSDTSQATELIRTSGSYKRAVRKKQYLNTASVRRRMDVQSNAKTVRGKAKAMMAISYRNNYAMQGSNEFMRFGKDEVFSGMMPGLYQFVKGGEYYDGLGYGSIAMAYRLDNKRSIKPTPWLNMAMKKEGTPEKVWSRFEDQLEKQLKRFS